jgi:hypothetical protein
MAMIPIAHDVKVAESRSAVCGKGIAIEAI